LALVPPLLEAYFRPDLGMVIFHPYTWNLEGKLGNLKEAFLQGHRAGILLLVHL
jgi:hypothetical protein